MSDNELRIPLSEATTEQLQSALRESRAAAKRCDELGGFYALHTHGKRADRIESVLKARRRRAA